MIGYIEFENANKIGNLKLDFLKNQKEAYNTIVLAGENGSGKTAILDLIANFQKGVYLREGSFVKKVEYFDMDGIKQTILRDEEALRFMKPEEMPEEDWEAFSGFTEQDFYEERYELREKVPADIRNSLVLYSEARSGFEIYSKTRGIEYDYENKKYEKDGADYSGIVRLLIDLEEKDNKEYLKYAKFHQKCTYDEYMRNNSSLARFKRAFEKIFDDISYLGMDSELNSNIVYFMKGDKQIAIDELSTGEKQIVFRGVDLLYHASDNATIFIDEPELSLHPKWQKKILDFYRSLFTDENGNQIAQIIIATHSQYVVQAAIKNREDIKVIILKRDGEMVKANTIEKAVLGNYSIAEVNYLAFGVEMVDYHIQLYAALHNLLKGITGSGVNDSISSIDQYIKNHSCYNNLLHEREDTSRNHYYTLPTYIRNAIDHPDSARTYSENDLEISIQLLRDIYITEKRD